MDRDATPSPTTPPPDALGAPSAHTVERRQITVMFCDLLNWAGISEQLDPEELRELLHVYQETCGTEVERFAGYVAQYLGDGILVYFGYPIAREDDAQRAVRSGMAIVRGVQALDASLPRRAGVRLAVRLGIHTGVVVIGGVGGRAHQEILALGEVPNVAARLQELVAPDQIVISGATHSLVRRYFDVQPLGEQVLKGLTHLVPAYRVVAESGALSRLEGVPTRGRPVVGREREREQLVAAWERAQGGTRQVVMVTGEAGIGKSRLVQYLREQIGGDSDQFLCQCSLLHAHSPLHPIIEALERRWRLTEVADDKMRLERVKHELRQAGQDPGPALPLFVSLLSLAPAHESSRLQRAPETMRHLTVEALLAWLDGVAAAKPLLLVIEDLHWADHSTVELAATLVARASAAQLLVAFTARPEFVPGWRIGENVAIIRLNPLTPEHAAEVVTNVAGDVALPRALCDAIVARADGVPLFLEELTRAVIESRDLSVVDRPEGGDPPGRAHVPATLVDLLMSRLDRLGGAKPVAQMASTIGRLFSLPLLRAVCGLPEESLSSHLRTLLEAEVIEPERAATSQDYRFRHVLIRDAAYQTQLLSRRREVHARVARVLEEHFPEIANTQPEVLGYHLSEAAQPGAAVVYWQRAGAQARRRGAYREAIEHLTMGLDLLPAVSSARERNHLELELLVSLGISLAAVHGFAVPKVGEIHQRARELCRLVEAGPLLLGALGGLWQFYYFRADFSTARDLAEQHLAAVQATGEHNRLCASHDALGYTAYRTGDLDRARADLERALELYDTIPRPEGTSLNPLDLGVAAQSGIAMVLCVHGAVDTALACARDAIERAERLAVRSEALSLAYAHTCASRVYLLRREPRLAAQHAGRAIALGQDHGYATPVTSGQLDMAVARIALGEPESGIDLLRSVLFTWRDGGFELDRPYWLGALADGHRKRGDFDRALAAVDEAIAHACEHGERVWDAELHRLRGEILLDRSADTRDEAAGELEAALGTARAQGARLFELRAAASLHRVRSTQSRTRESRASLGAVLDWFKEGFHTVDLQEARELLAAASPEAESGDKGGT